MKPALYKAKMKSLIDINEYYRDKLGRVQTITKEFEDICGTEILVQPIWGKYREKPNFMVWLDHNTKVMSTIEWDGEEEIKEQLMVLRGCLEEITVPIEHYVKTNKNEPTINTYVEDIKELWDKEEKTEWDHTRFNLLLNGLLELDKKC